jgi:undecaprenyl-diphosphatase
MSTALQAALLGVVQGVTEFLPVSSTAHLILARVFFGFDGDKFGLAFDVALHVGTLVAVLVYFRRQLAMMVAALPSVFQPARDQWARMIWLLAIGTIPAVVVGLFFGDVIEDRLRTVPVVAATLAIVALGLFWAERATSNTRSESSITFVEAFMIGCAQAAALVPGVSRSGATLVAALAIGLRRTEAAQFIFLLAIPAILGAAVREIPAILRAGFAGDAALFAIGVVTSAVVGYLVIKFFIRYLARHSLDVFAWYRLALAGAAMVWLAVAPS